MTSLYGPAEDTGASATPSGSRASMEPASSLHPTGFDPSRNRLFNVNYDVAVRLTDFGRKALRENWEAWAGPLDIGPYHPRKTDENGWTRFQLWQLMEELGPHISMCGPLPFETTIAIVGPFQEASGIEAPSGGETQSGSTEGESPTRQGDAQSQPLGNPLDTGDGK